MALISKKFLTEISKERASIHGVVKATYSGFEVAGQKYFQIDTYGNKARQNKDTISQSLQLDRETAEYLIKLLTNHFDL